jgi:hypothetical protein
MRNPIINYKQERAGIQMKDGKEVGVIHIEYQELGESLIHKGFYNVEEGYNDIEVDIYQSVEAYLCHECSMDFDPYRHAAKEENCEKHGDKIDTVIVQ